MENISRRTFLAFTAGAAMANRLTAWPKIADVPTLLDHILLGCSDLNRGIDFIEKRADIPVTLGGVHPGRGTQNALLTVGIRRYLEIIAPDPTQAESKNPMAIKLRKLTEPRLVGWAAHPGDLQSFAAKLREAGVAFEGPTPGSRKRPDGRVLSWKTLNLADDYNGLLPFFIEWSADSVHPSADSDGGGCTLMRFEAATPDPDTLGKQAALLGLDLLIVKAETHQLLATFAGPDPKNKFTITS